MFGKYKCPHCGEPGISFLRKTCLGPAWPATCTLCGKKVGVPYIGMLAVIPLIAGVLGSDLVEPLALKAGLWVGGAVAMATVHMLWVPLERR
jgi:hypothetical protein